MKSKVSVLTIILIVLVIIFTFLTYFQYEKYKYEENLYLGFLNKEPFKSNINSSLTQTQQVLLMELEISTRVSDSNIGNMYLSYMNRAYSTYLITLFVLIIFIFLSFLSWKIDYLKKIN